MIQQIIFVHTAGLMINLIYLNIVHLVKRFMKDLYMNHNIMEIMLQYFGETTSNPCGVCDLCLTQHNHTKASSIREQILQLLEKQPLRSDQLLELLPHNDEDMVKQELRQLVNEDIVCINDALQFTV